MPIVIRNIFEDFCKEKFDVKDCVAVNNGSSALIAPLWSMDLQPGDEIITTELEHHSNFLPWQSLSKKNNLIFNTDEQYSFK